MPQDEPPMKLHTRHVLIAVLIGVLLLVVVSLARGAT